MKRQCSYVDGVRNGNEVTSRWKRQDRWQKHTYMATRGMRWTTGTDSGAATGADDSGPSLRHVRYVHSPRTANCRGIGPEEMRSEEGLHVCRTRVQRGLGLGNASPRHPCSNFESQLWNGNYLIHIISSADFTGTPPKSLHIRTVSPSTLISRFMVQHNITLDWNRQLSDAILRLHEGVEQTLPINVSSTEILCSSFDVDHTDRISSWVVNNPF